MERTTQRGLLLHVTRHVRQRLHSLPAVAHHLARLLQEDFEQFRIDVVRRSASINRSRSGLRIFFGYRLCRSQHSGLARPDNGGGNGGFGYGTCGSRGDIRLRTGTAFRALPFWQASRVGFGLDVRSGKLHVDATRDLGHGAGLRRHPTHEWPELTRFSVIGEELLGQHRLVAQRVDQKTQGTEVAAQSLEAA